MRDMVAAAVSWALVVSNIAWDAWQLAQQGEYKKIQSQLIAALGWRTGEVRGTAIVSGESPA